MTIDELHDWLVANHATADEFSVELWKKGTGVTSVTWNDVVDECLCVGWIDGRGNRIDDERWTIRITPRRTVDLGSIAVADVMTRDPVYISPDMDTARALDVLRSRTLAAVPVVQNGQLVGLVTEHQYMAIADQLLVQELGGMPSS